MIISDQVELSTFVVCGTYPDLKFYRVSDAGISCPTESRTVEKEFERRGEVVCAVLSPAGVAKVIVELEHLRYQKSQTDKYIDELEGNIDRYQAALNAIVNLPIEATCESYDFARSTAYQAIREPKEVAPSAETNEG